MKKIGIQITTILFVFFLSAVAASAEWASFVGKGSAVVIEGNRAGAENLASKAALRKAVSLAIESLIQKGTKEEVNYNLKKPELLRGPFPFLTERRTLSEKTSGKLLAIEVEVTVDKEALSRLLAQKGVITMQAEERKKADFPSIMVIVVEEIGGKLNRFPFSSNLIVDELIKKEFEIVDQAVIQKSIKHDQAVQGVLSGDSQAAQAIALQYGAGMLITGKAVAQQGLLKSGAMQAFNANVALQAIHADSGKVIASASASGSYPHIEAVTGSRKALEEAAKKAIDELLKDIEKSFESSEESVLVSITGISFAQLAILKKILKRDFKTITSIQQKSYAGGVTKLDLKIDSSPEGFAEDVVLKDFGTFRLDVLSFSPRKIDFTLKMK